MKIASLIFIDDLSEPTISNPKLSKKKHRSLIPSHVIAIGTGWHSATQLVVVDCHHQGWPQHAAWFQWNCRGGSRSWRHLFHRQLSLLSLLLLLSVEKCDGLVSGTQPQNTNHVVFFYPFTLDLACGTCTFIKNILLFFVE